MDLGMRHVLQDHGLEDKRDYTVVEIEFPKMMAALTAGRVDLGFLTTPFSVAPVKTGAVRVLFTMKDAMGGPSELTVIAARTPFIAAHRAALVDLFRGYRPRFALDSRSCQPSGSPAARRGFHQTAGREFRGLDFHQGR